MIRNDDHLPYEAAAERLAQTVMVEQIESSPAFQELSLEGQEEWRRWAQILVSAGLQAKARIVNSRSAQGAKIMYSTEEFLKKTADDTTPATDRFNQG